MEDTYGRIKDLAVSDPARRSDIAFGPVSEEELAKVEQTLEVKLPRSFYMYLKEFAGGLFLGYEICGIPTEKANASTLLGAPVKNSIYDLVEANLRRRKHFPRQQVFFCDDGGDFSFFLDTHHMSPESECPVIMYGPGSMGAKVAETFLDFLEALAGKKRFLPA